MTARTQVLLTGFEPFTTGQGLKLDHNPTADIVRRVAHGLEGVDYGVLPVSYRRTPEALEALWREHMPRIWIGLGYAPHRQDVDIETIAVNVEDCVGSDNDGYQPTRQRIIEGGPIAYETTLDMPLALHCFQAHEVVAKAAFHAGTFMCNQVFYLGCHRQAAGHLEVAAFIHVPPMNDWSPFHRALDSLVKTLRGA